MDTTEELREALLDLEEAGKRERQQRQVSEALLAGLHAIVMARDPDGIFHGLLDVLREPLDFKAAFVLREKREGTLTVAVSSDPAFADTVWRPQAMFERVFAGRPVAVYDTELVDEWRPQPDLVKQRARSALHFAIHASEPGALFVCTHPERSHFSGQHVTLARRFSVLAMQALQKIEFSSRLADLQARLDAEVGLVAANKKLAKGQLQLRQVIDLVPHMIYAKDRDGRFIMANKSTADGCGTTADSVVGRQYPALLGATPAEYESFLADDREVIDSGKPKVIPEESFTYPNGHTGVLETTKIPFTAAGIPAVLGISIDITERRRAEEELKRLVFEKDKRVKELGCLYGIGTSIRRHESIETILQEVVELIPSGWRYPEIARARIVFDGKEVVSESFEECKWYLSSEFDVRGKRGIVEVFYLEDRPKADQGPFLKEERDLLNAIARMLGEMIERKATEKEMDQLEEQYHQAQKMESIGRLAGGVAHDFNNLLAVILLTSELMSSGLHERDPLLDDIRQISDAARRGETLTRQLLAFSRRQVLQPVTLTVNRTLESLDEMLRRLIGEDVDLVTATAPELWKIVADPGQIEQIVMNLVVNARDAMPGAGKLTIETANVDLDEEYAGRHSDVTPGPYVMLAVSDTGHGMDAETRERVFEPFFTTKEKGRGTGLGLSTVYGIVKQHGGNIWVYSEPGEGTAFKVYLPRAAVDAPCESSAPDAAGDLRGAETVLVVEDETPVLKAAVRMLERQGYTVLQARDGLEAQTVANGYEGRIHLLLTDVVMPKASGPETADRLRAGRPEMKVLFMSGYTDEAIVHRRVLDKRMHFVQKPFTVDLLARSVRKALDEPAPSGNPR